MTGSAVPLYIQSPVPSVLVEHWTKFIPDFVAPDFRHEIAETSTVVAYLPLESFKDRHVIDPFVHYELAGKAAIPHMTKLTTKLLADTEVERPCVVKVSHSMGSRGIFLVRNDEEQEEVLKLIDETGKPSYVVTEFLDIERNLAAHFFIHPSGDITWFGSSENLLDKDGGWSADSTIRCPQEQDELRELMAPYVQEVVQYCVKRGYWGACGIDVLVDSKGKGFVVDVNPRVTGTCPALMAFQKLCEMDKTRFSVGTFRRSKQYAFTGSAEELLAAVDAHNSTQDQTRVLIFSLFEKKPGCTLINIGVFGSSQVQCIKVLNQFATKNQS
jgi:predicted ATP-grasp superfamily ATP-dependent carboligase